MSKSLRAPWYKFYDSEKQHLEYPDFSAYKLIEYTASKHLNNISYNYYGNKKTYHEFLKQIDDVARSFKAIGVKRKDVVSICMPNTPEGIISFYAANKIGAIASMIHPLSAENEIKQYLNVSKTEWLVTIDFAFNKVNHILKDTKLKKIITVSVADSMPMYMVPIYVATKGYKIRLEKCDIQVGWRDFLKYGKEYTKEIDDEFKGKEIAAILYSGGTTGTPKGVKLTNLNLNASAMQNFEHVACLRDKDKVLAIMPIFHGFGLSVCIHCVQYFGGTSILLPQFDARTFDKIIKKYEPNVVVGVPTLFEAMTKNKNFNHMKLSYIRCVISGGDSLSIELKKKFDEWLDKHGSETVIREGYGLTECCAASCFTPLNYYRPGSIGIPYPDMYYKIVEEGTETEVPYGVEGEIVITGPTVMDGYIRNRKETKSTLRKHKDGRIWLHTGDQGIMDEDGFVYFKGRIKRMIVRHDGFKVYPGSIEKAIQRIPSVGACCVVGQDDDAHAQGKVPVAFVVLKGGVKKNASEVYSEIKNICNVELPEYAQPVEVNFIDSLPLTPIGKIDYMSLERN